MTPEENKRRSEDQNVNYIKEHICDCDGDESYVFISYKSDDWEVVLHDIVYRLVKDYGLNVYFDGSFDSHNDLWIEQFPKNMGTHQCKGVIAFFDDKYATSYATLMELLYSQTKKAVIGKAAPNKGLPIVSIDLEKLTKITDAAGQRDTGLGVHTYEDGSVNINYKNELKLFKDCFKELVKRGILKDAQYIWKKGDKLNAAICSEIVMEIKAYKKINENYYSSGMSLDGIVSSIKNACGAEVFSPVTPLDEPDKVQEPLGSGKQKQQEINPVQDGYKYTIFGKEYTAGKGEQGKLMFDAFEALIERYPGCEEKLTQRTSVAKAENVKKPGTPESYPTYFRGYKAFKVNGQTYLVGTSYDFKAKLSQIKGMFKICGASLSEFILNGEPLEAKDFSSQPGDGSDEKAFKKINENYYSSGMSLDGIVSSIKNACGAEVFSPVTPSDEPDKVQEPLESDKQKQQEINPVQEEYKYTIFGKEYTAGKGEQGKLMFDAFEALIERYPGCEEKLIQKTSIAKAEDVKKPGTTESYPTYFKCYKAFKVNGQTYLVGASYNFKAKLSEIKGMFKICGASLNEFILNGKPLGAKDFSS